MKVAQICLSLGKGGAEKLLVDNADEYKMLGVDYEIIQLSSILEEPSYIQKMNSIHVPVYSLGKGGFFKIKYLFKLIKLISKKRYDVVHVHLFPCFYYIAIIKPFLKNSPKLIFTEHSVKNGRSNLWLFKIMEPFIYRQYDHIIAISKNVESMLSAKLPSLKSKIVLINNGVNTKLFRNAIEYDKFDFKKELGFNDDCILIGMTARFSAPKDFLTIVDSLQYLPSNYCLCLIGDGPLLENIIQHSKKLKLEDRIAFMGFREDVPRLMKTMDINVLSSDFEGLSGVTLEALASGVTFLGSDVPGINDIVPNSTFLFPAGNSEDLASSIENLVNNRLLRAENAQLGLQQSELYDSYIMVEKHMRIYKMK